MADTETVSETVNASNPPSDEKISEEASFSGNFEFELSKTKVALRMGVDATKKGGLVMLRSFKWMVVKTVAIISVAVLFSIALVLKLRSPK